MKKTRVKTEEISRAVFLERKDELAERLDTSPDSIKTAAWTKLFNTFALLTWSIIIYIVIVRNEEFVLREKGRIILRIGHKNLEKWKK